MRINEVERLVGVSKKSIRYYEEEGLLTPARENGNGYRSYSDADVRALRTIRLLRRLGIPPEIIRQVSIAMYEGEINMVIHAGGGDADVIVSEDRIEIILADHGPGIADIDLAMQEGYSTAPDSVRSLGFGAGMGLPNMKRYTDEMTIDSTVGVGTTIRMVVKLQ